MEENNIKSEGEILNNEASFENTLNPEIQEQTSPIEEKQYIDVSGIEQKSEGNANIPLTTAKKGGFLDFPIALVEKILNKEDKEKKKVIFIMLGGISALASLYSIITNTASLGVLSSILIFVLMTIFIMGYLFIDGVGLWLGAKILGGKGKFMDTLVVTLSISVLYGSLEIITTLLTKAIGAGIASLVSLILYICILVILIRLISSIQHITTTRSFFSALISGILIYVWTTLFFGAIVGILFLFVAF